MNDAYEAFQKAVEQVFPGGFTLRDEANAIVAYAFRNGPLEHTCTRASRRRFWRIQSSVASRTRR